MNSLGSSHFNTVQFKTKYSLGIVREYFSTVPLLKDKLNDGSIQ
jgi:hypothetical protein